MNQIDSCRREVRLSHLKITWCYLDFYNDLSLSLARERRPGFDEERWIPNYSWPLPIDHISVDEARRKMQEWNREAMRRWQAAKQQRAEVQRQNVLAGMRHEEPELPGKLRTEPHPNGGTTNWIE